MERVNQLLDLTEGKKGKYKGLKPETIYDTFNTKMKDEGVKQNSSDDKTRGINMGNDGFKNINIGMDLDGVHYIPNMDINQLKNSKNNKNSHGQGNISKTKKEVTPPKTMFSVKA